MRRFLTLRSIFLAVLLLIASWYFSPIAAWAGPTSWEAGLRAGASFNDDDESFNQYDIALSFGLPWSWQWGQSLQVDTRMTTAVSLLDGGGDTGVAGSVGIEFVFSPAGGSCPFELRAGSAVTLISEDEYGDEDLGGPVQFTHHISLYYWLMDELSLMARLQHMSNAGLYSENPGLDMVMLGLIYRF